MPSIDHVCNSYHRLFSGICFSLVSLWKSFAIDKLAGTLSTDVSDITVVSFIPSLLLAPDNVCSRNAVFHVCRLIPASTRTMGRSSNLGGTRGMRRDVTPVLECYDNAMAV